MACVLSWIWDLSLFSFNSGQMKSWGSSVILSKKGLNTCPKWWSYLEGGGGHQAFQLRNLFLQRPLEPLCELKNERSHPRNIYSPVNNPARINLSHCSGNVTRRIVQEQVQYGARFMDVAIPTIWNASYQKSKFVPFAIDFCRSRSIFLPRNRMKHASASTTMTAIPMKATAMRMKTKKEKALTIKMSRLKVNKPKTAITMESVACILRWLPGREHQLQRNRYLWSKMFLFTCSLQLSTVFAFCLDRLFTLLCVS